MKKIKYLLAILVLVFAATSCENDGGDSKIELINGSSANIRKDPALSQSLNYFDILAGTPVKLGITIDNVYQSDFVSADIVGFYKKGSAIEKKIMKTNVTGFPAQYSFTDADLVNIFDVLNTSSDFYFTDELTVTAELIKADGTRIKLFNDNGTQAYGTSINNLAAVKNFQTFGFSCPLNDASSFDGDYKVVQDVWADYAAGDIVPLEYDAALGTYKFKILASNNPYIDNASTAYLVVTVNPTTLNVTVASNEPFQYTGWETLNITGSGSVNACTGRITLKVNYGPYAGYNLVLDKN